MQIILQVVDRSVLLRILLKKMFWIAMQIHIQMELSMEIKQANLEIKPGLYLLHYRACDFR